MENRLNLKNLEYVCSLMKDILNVSFHVLDKKGTLIIDISPNESFNPLYPSKQSFFRQVFRREEKRSPGPTIRSTPFYETVFFIPIGNLGTVILGPVLSSRPTQVLIDELISSYGKKEMEESLRKYYHSLPVINRSKLIQVSKLFYFLYHKKIEDQDIIAPEMQMDNQLIDEKMCNKHMLEIHQNSSFHHDPIAEKKVYQYIMDGHKEKLLAYWKAFKENTSFDFGKLSKKNEVRNQKNLSIATITLATRAAISGGLHPEIAYSLGDSFIQDLEELQNKEDIHLFTENILYEFASRVEKAKRENHSRPIFQCKNYI